MLTRSRFTSLAVGSSRKTAHISSSRTSNPVCFSQTLHETQNFCLAPSCPSTGHEHRYQLLGFVVPTRRGSTVCSILRLLVAFGCFFGTTLLRSFPACVFHCQTNSKLRREDSNLHVKSGSHAFCMHPRASPNHAELPARCVCRFATPHYPPIFFVLHLDLQILRNEHFIHDFFDRFSGHQPAYFHLRPNSELWASRHSLKSSGSVLLVRPSIPPNSNSARWFVSYPDPSL